MVSIFDVRIDDVGLMLNFCIGSSLGLSTLASQLRLTLPVGFTVLEASTMGLTTEFPYRVPIVDRGTIATKDFIAVLKIP